MVNITYPFRLAAALIRENVVKALSRSNKWSAFRAHTLKAHPTCAACGTKSLRQVHHIKPFHDNPELELDPQNVLVLCATPSECHLFLGHGGYWKAYNPNVVADAAAHLAAPPAERTAIRAKAKAARVRI